VFGIAPLESALRPRSDTETDFPRQVRSAKRSRFAATVFVRSKPVNCVRILTKMFMFLTDTTKTDFHADTMNTSSSFAGFLPFTRTQSTDLRWRRRHCLWPSRAMRKRRSSVFLKTPIGFSLPTAISTMHIGMLSKGSDPKMYKFGPPEMHKAFCISTSRRVAIRQFTLRGPLAPMVARPPVPLTTQNRLKALEAAQFRQFTLLTSYLMREIKSVIMNVRLHSIDLQGVWEGKFRLNPLQVAPNASEQLV